MIIVVNKGIKDHCDTTGHENSLKSWKNQGTIQFQKAADPAEEQARKAEDIAASFLIQHNLSATADHLGPLFRQIFPGRTKTSAIINETLGPYCHD